MTEPKSPETKTCHCGPGACFGPSNLLPGWHCARNADLQELVELRKLKTEVWENPEKWMKWCDHKMLDRLELLRIALFNLRAAEQRAFGDVVITRAGRCGVELSIVIDLATELIALLPDHDTRIQPT